MELSLVVTHACNLRCSYCYTGEKKGVTMPREVAEAALDLAFGLPSHVPLQIGFFGGEPMLAWPMVERVATEARRRAEAAGRPLRLQMTTNGTLLDVDRVQQLRSLGVHVALSHDGTREAHEVGRLPVVGAPSSFDAVERALDLLLEGGEPFSVIAVVHPGNVSMLGQSVQQLVDRGVRALTLNVDWGGPWDDVGLAELSAGYEHVAAVWLAWRRRGVELRIEPLASALRLEESGRPVGSSCAAGHNRLAVAPSGRLYACARSVGEDTGKGSIGHVFEAFERPAFRAPEGDGACHRCAARDRCERHCACACREETGDPIRPGPVLCAHQHILEELVRRLSGAVARDGTLAVVR